jgi:UDP-2,3-diacylglucosamine pyrophosphatase LpxH
MRHTVVISDIHLCEVEPGTSAWMRYRQRHCLPDADIGRMLDALCLRVGNDPMTLILGGDIFDFDAPRVIDGVSQFHDLPRTAEHAVPAMAAILDDHPLFVDAVARVLRQGHDVVFISGNHDAVLTLPEVRSLLAARIADAALAGTCPSLLAYHTLRARIFFRAWFHLTPDQILVEHGHLYDPYCAFRYPMAPYLDDGREIVPTIGSIGTRVLVARLGYFNPHVDRSFNLTKAGYAWHWVRYYLFTRRSIVWFWVYGVTSIMTRIVRARQRPNRAWARSNLVACVRETGARLLATARHARLLETPADDIFSIARDLWVDRVIVFLGSAALGITLGVQQGLPWGLLWLLLPFAVFPLYNRFAPKPRLAESWERVTNVMHRLARVHRARAVIFGHTHHPAGTWEDGTFYGNSGSWSAAVSTESGELLVDERPLVWLRTNDEGEISGGLYTWTHGMFEERAVRGEYEGERMQLIVPTGDEASVLTD